MFAAPNEEGLGELLTSFDLLADALVVAGEFSFLEQILRIIRNRLCKYF